jgi:hypothetical protein
MLATISHPAESLQAEIAGAVILPGSDRYAAARQAWNLTVDQHPALIVVATCAADVAAAVRYARNHDLRVAVQATGHGVRRPANGALLILTGQMNGVEVDPVEETAWIECGAQWQVVLAAAQPYGLAPLLGSSPTVGAVGYTLGGGMGWLARKYGMAADSVNYFEVVTPEGSIVHASQDENPDLFWALRGGGGSFGIVVGMEIDLYPVATVYGGNLFYPVSAAGEVMRRFRTWAATLPEEMTASVVLMNFPPIPQIPEPLRGQSFVMVRGCYAGDLAAGEELVNFWRTWRQPLIDDFKAMPFSQVATISNDPTDPMPGLSTGAWLAQLSDASIDALVRYVTTGAGPRLITLAEIRLAGGAIARAGASMSAFSHRDARLSLQLVSTTPTAEAMAASQRYGDELKAALAPDLTGGVYINFLDGEEALRRTQDAYTAANFQRLQKLKRRVDPGDRFHHGFNILPV